MNVRADARHVAGVGPPMLLVHGLGATRRAWDPVLERLRSRHEVAVVDLPGFGDAPLDDGGGSYEGVLGALEEHLDELGWSRAHLVGSSMGGALVLDLAARRRALSVTALSPGGMLSPAESRRSRLMFRTLLTVGPPVRPLAEILVRTAVGRAVALGAMVARPGRLDAELALAMVHGFLDAPGTAPVLDDLRDLDLGDRLPLVDVPTTIAWGTRDRVLNQRMGPRFKQSNPSFRLVRLRGLGHVPMSDDPELVASVVLRTAGSPGASVAVTDG